MEISGSKITINYSDVVADIVETTKLTEEQVSSVLNGLSNIILYYAEGGCFDDGESKNTIIIRLLKGLTIISKPMKEREYILKGKKIVAGERRKTRAVLSNYYKRNKINKLK